LNYQVILGTDFLHAQKATIRFETNQLILQDIIKVPFVSASYQKSYPVSVIGNVSIPPRSETVFRVYCKQGYNKCALIEPHVTNLSALHLMGAKCIVQNLANQAMYKVINPTNVEIKLHHKQHIGQWIPVSTETYIHNLDTSESCTINSMEDTCTETLSEEAIKQIISELGIDLSNSDLTPKQCDELQKFIASNRDVFAKDLTELGTTNVHFHEIDTGDAHPVRQRFYRTSPKMKQEIDRQIKEMLEAKVIEPSTSPWASPVVLLKKKSGDYRFAVDFRKVNRVTRPISFPLPRPDDVYDIIGESHAQIFTVLDLASGFWQIRVHPNSREKTAFTSHSGHYQFRKMPFGLTNAPSVFRW
jgi:hypothetical protein